MKASLTLRENPKNPILKAKIPLSILGVPFRSGIEAGDYDELCISFCTAFCSGPLLKFCYRPNDSCRPFGLILRTGVGQFGSPVSMSSEFSLIGDIRRPRFLLHFKPRSGDFSFRRSVGTPAISFSSQNHASWPIQSGEEKLNLNWNWNQLFSSAYRVVSDGEVCTTTSAPINRAVVKLGWSVKFPPPVFAEEGGGGGGSGAQTLLKELPHLVLRKIAIESAAEDERGKGKKREVALLKSENYLLKSEKMDDLKLEFEHEEK